MNRSILIVICDFLVLSAMSLTIGVDPRPGQGTVRTVSHRTLAERIRSNEKSRADAEASAKRNAEDAAELRKKLEELRKTSDVRDSELDSASKELEQKQAALKRQEDALRKAELLLAAKAAAEASTKQLLNAKDQALSAKDALLAEKTAAELRARKEIAERERRLEEKTASEAAARKALAAKDTAMRDKDSILNAAMKKIANVSVELSATAGKLRESEQGLFYIKGRLSLAEKNAADTEAKAKAAEARMRALEQALTQARTNLLNTEQSLAARDAELRKTKGSLGKTQEVLVQTMQKFAAAKQSLTDVQSIVRRREQDLQFARNRLTETERMLRSDALNQYFKSARALEFHVKNDRLMNTFEQTETLYLPEVRWGGSVWLVGEFRTLTGLKRHSGYTRVLELSYKVGKPDTDGKEFEAIGGPIYALAEENALCLIKLKKSDAENALVPMTYAELKTRGVQNLTLFKAGSFGKEAASLEGRCSLSMNPGKPFLYIRNSVRNLSEITAEPGDFVLTKEGRLAGIVVRVKNSEGGRKEEAYCYILPSKPNLTGAIEIALDRKAGEPYYTKFAESVTKLKALVK